MAYRMRSTAAPMPADQFMSVPDWLRLTPAGPGRSTVAASLQRAPHASPLSRRWRTKRASDDAAPIELNTITVEQAPIPRPRPQRMTGAEFDERFGPTPLEVQQATTEAMPVAAPPRAPGLYNQMGLPTGAADPAGVTQPQSGGLGLLSSLTGSRGPGLLNGKFGGFLRDNSDALMMMGAGMMSGGIGSGQGLAGFMAGSQSDKARRDEAAKEQEREARVAALREWAQSRVQAGGMTEAEAKLIEAYPELAGEFMGGGREDLINAGEGRLYDPSSGQWIMAPDAEGGALFDGNSVEGQALNQLVQRGVLTPEQALDVAAGKTITDPSTGAILFAPPSVLAGGQGGAAALTGPRAPTEGQANANLYASRMEAAEPIIEQFGAAGLSLQDQMLSQVPIFGNMMVSDEFQQLDQAQRDFINATLRRESGAVISDQEFENARRQYFPQPGDKPEVLARKRESRRIAREQIRAAAGPAFPAQQRAPESAPTPSPDDGWTEIEPGVRMREVP